MSRSLHILIVEDEALYADLLEEMITELGHRHLGTFRGSAEVPDFVRKHRPDLILMDIQIEGVQDGIELADALQEIAPIPVLFITSLTDDETFARAKSTRPYAFIEKSARKRQLGRAIELAADRIRQESEPRPPKPQAENTVEGLLMVRTQNALKKVRIADIRFVLAEDHYCNLHTADHKFVSRISLTELLEVLPKEEFIRTHRSCLVRVDAIDSVSVSEGVIHIGEHALPLGRTYKDEFLRRLRLI